MEKIQYFQILCPYDLDTLFALPPVFMGNLGAFVAHVPIFEIGGRRSEIGVQRSEIGDQRSEYRDRRSEV